MPDADFDFACGCRLSVHDTDTYCEDHTHTPVVREGPSHRTGDELSEQLLEDAADLLYPGLPVTEPEWDACLEQCAEDHAANGRWLGNDDLREELHDLARQAEERLAEEGWTVDWNDGYTISRPTADNPVAELRHRREVNG